MNEIEWCLSIEHGCGKNSPTKLGSEVGPDPVCQTLRMDLEQMIAAKQSWPGIAMA